MRQKVVFAILLTLGLAAPAGCAASTGGGATGPALPPGTGALDLKSVCPATITLQMNWYPQAEHGGLYRLLGQTPSVDAQHSRISGPLVFDGHDTGVRLEIRSGGPVVGYQPVSALLAADPSITLGVAATDEQVEQAGSHPLLAVFAPMDVNPQMIMWSPQAHPDWKTIADIGRTDTTVLYTSGASYMDYLVDSGLLKKSQIDGSYSGSPARFVASGGQIAQQGYVTNEPYSYEHEVPQWDKPVAYQLVSDTGYPVYPESVVIRPGDLTRLTPCLRKLVPIFQRSTVDYMANPDPTDRMIATVVGQFNGAYSYSFERATFAVHQMAKFGIVRNGTDGVLGSFDLNRVQRVIDLLRHLAAERGGQIRPGLTATDIVTDQFLDRTVSLR